QAEDGIRCKLVTGVQTCALPISEKPLGEGGATPTPCVGVAPPSPEHTHRKEKDRPMPLIKARTNRVKSVRHICRLQEPNRDALRSEESRVGKEVRAWVTPVSEEK